MAPGLGQRAWGERGPTAAGLGPVTTLTPMPLPCVLGPSAPKEDALLGTPFRVGPCGSRTRGCVTRAVPMCTGKGGGLARWAGGEIGMGVSQ